MAFDVTLQPLGMSIALPQDDSADELEVLVVVGLVLPFDTGQGPMVIPFGNVRFPMNRDFAVKFADSLKTEAEKLPEQTHSQIAIANSLEGVDRIAGIDKQIRGS